MPEKENQEISSYSEIIYPQIIFAHPHLIEPIFIRNPESFEIYNMIDQNFDYYEKKFLLEKKLMFEKIANLLNSYPVIIFIKGTPTDPFCKFSKAFMELIKKNEIKYKSFDIFKDEGLRCWLRIYSGWKTYPQLYINGKIIGGVDKLNELMEKNIFLDMVPKECKKEGSLLLIENLVEKNGVIVFGEGTLAKPQCKISQEAYRILTGLNIKFEIFDILTDEVWFIIFLEFFKFFFTFYYKKFKSLLFKKF